MRILTSVVDSMSGGAAAKTVSPWLSLGEQRSEMMGLARGPGACQLTKESLITLAVAYSCWVAK